MRAGAPSSARRLAQRRSARGHEVSAHGWRWESHAGIDEATERERIARTVAAIRRRPASGRSAGTRGRRSPNTRRLLVEEGGFLYDSDAYNDDLPYFVQVADRRHLVLPYAFDTNDMQFPDTDRFRGARFRRLCDRRLRLAASRRRARAEDDVDRPASAHDRRPGRIAALDRILRHIADRGDAWIARRVDIARHWLAKFPDGV